MSKSLFYGSLVLLILVLLNKNFNYSLLMFFYVFEVLLFFKNKKIFLLINSLVIFEILFQFKNIFSFSPLIDVEKWLLKNINNTKVKSFISLVLFNDKNDSIYNLTINLSISYLVIISGMHINAIFKTINGVLSLFFHERFSTFSSFIVILGYLFIIGFPISATRAFISLLVNKCYKKFNKYDCFFISFIIIYIINPYSIFTLSFIYSFLLSFMIISLASSLPKNRFLASFIVSFFSFLTSLPLSISYFNRINLFSFLYSCILYYPFIISLICSFMVLFFPFLDGVLYYYIVAMEKSLWIFTKLKTYLYLMPFSKKEYIIYYLVIILAILAFNKKKKSSFQAFLLSFLYNCFLLP